MIRVMKDEETEMNSTSGLGFSTLVQARATELC
jgi:hypothetical protein